MARYHDRTGILHRSVGPLRDGRRDAPLPQPEHRCPASAASATRSATSLGRMLGLVRLWIEKRRQRLELAELNDHQLADIGLTRDEARREAAQPFWR